MNTHEKLICRVVDAGARYGLHPTWESLRDVAHFHLFEPDADEAGRLRQKYANRPNIAVDEVALHSKKTELTFSIRKHKALCTVSEVNVDMLERDNYMVREFEVTGNMVVQADTIDNVFPAQDVHFLKLDVEGNELEVLKGARKQLSTSILGARVEVIFAPLYKGNPLFGDIHEFMLEQGFELLNLDYDGRGAPRSPFTHPNRFGKLISSDGVWTLPPDVVFEASRPERTADVIRLAVFYFINRATDAALEILLRAVREEGLSFADFADTPLFRALHKSVAILFKDISYLPSMDSKMLAEAYEAIFERPYPELHEFYQSDIFM